MKNNYIEDYLYTPLKLLKGTITKVLTKLYIQIGEIITEDDYLNIQYAVYDGEKYIEI